MHVERAAIVEMLWPMRRSQTDWELVSKKKIAENFSEAPIF